MAYFRRVHSLEDFPRTLARDQRWLVLINADPDAMASALALKRILSHRVHAAEIAKVNVLSRPDNLAMAHYTHVRMLEFGADMAKEFDHFALLDSQPEHHSAFDALPFTLIVDHHPLPERQIGVPFAEIRPEYGATSTLMTELLYNLKIRPGKLLATALQFGIKTDTGNFERHCSDVDLRAFRYLARFADQHLLLRIARSEFHEAWLKTFARACTSLYDLSYAGRYCYVGEVGNPDILVNIADFLMRVYEIRWVAVCGRHDHTLVIIFRGDGISRNLGRLSRQVFGSLGFAGGHRAMARAEIPVEKAEDEDIELFIWKKLIKARLRPEGKGADAGC
ncbi:MAG: DHH family phosphoesterase [Desulfovibrio sp.]|jgi:nanoRNase/pAp phosphatase (c-di-AMP/oligoRNAs hydrolase)|nr:DHH family phosphoesterase [Desulfovibrio sp.]